MNTNIVISLDTRRSKKDGSFPLVMRLGHNERTTSIPIGISILEKDWDSKNRIIKKAYVGVNSVSRLNNMIQKQKSDALDIIFKLNETGELATLSLVALRDKLINNSKGKSFIEFGKEVVASLITAKRIGTARSYRGVLSVLKEFHNDREVLFSDITYSFLMKFETAHLQKGNAYNGLAVYMRTLRAIYNKGIKAGVVDKEFYPFSQYKIRTEPTEKRALEWEFLKKIIEMQLEPTHILFHTRNYFVASYMMYGMNYTDMAFLQKEAITSGRIHYRRKKTSKLYDIKITPQLDTILKYYQSLNKDSLYVFPIIKREGVILQDKDIRGARSRYNKKLNKLAKLLGIETNLTSYVSRHSFATQAMLHQVPLNAISTMLGHSSLKTTEVYIKSLPSNILDDYNALLMVS
jgi:integrase/recombinase XerD